MFSENQSKARIGKVSIDIKANRYRIRFTSNGSRMQFVPLMFQAAQTAEIYPLPILDS